MDDLPGDVMSMLPEKEIKYRRYFVRLTDSSHWKQFTASGFPIIAGPTSPKQRSIDWPWPQGIHADTEWREFLGQRLGKGKDRAFRRSIGGATNHAGNCVIGGHVYDDAVTPVTHLWEHSLTAQESAFDVDVHHQSPDVFWNVGAGTGAANTRIIEQSMHGPDIADDTGHHLVHGAPLRDVDVCGGSLAALGSRARHALTPLA
jgi:hypothetical protein